MQGFVVILALKQSVPRLFCNSIFVLSLGQRRRKRSLKCGSGQGALAVRGLIQDVRRVFDHFFDWGHIEVEGFVVHTFIP